MAYSDATFIKLKKLYGLHQDYKDLKFKNIPEIPPSNRLTEDIEEGKQMQITSEKAKSEFILAPIIRELQRKNKEVTFFSGVSFNIQGESLLNGRPDFMISAKPRRAGIEAPIFCMVEAKNGIIEEGYAQCAAEMYAAKLFNKQTQESLNTIYGAVTNAFDWVFLKLENKQVYIDVERYYLNELPRLLGIMQYIIDTSKK